jgi:hypothetical protein
VMLRVTLTEQFFCGKEMFPVFEDLWAEASLAIWPRQLWFPIVKKWLLLRYEGVEGLAVSMPECQQLGTLVLFLIPAHEFPP